MNYPLTAAVDNHSAGKGRIEAIFNDGEPHFFMAFNTYNNVRL